MATPTKETSVNERLSKGGPRGQTVQLTREGENEVGANGIRPRRGGTLRTPWGPSTCVPKSSRQSVEGTGTGA